MRVEGCNVLFPVVSDAHASREESVSEDVDPQEVHAPGVDVVLPQIAVGKWNRFAAFFYINMGARSFTSKGMDPSEHVKFLKDALVWACQQDSRLPPPAPILKRLEDVVILNGNTRPQELLGLLKVNKTLDLFSGYTSHPGHAVLVHLQLGEDDYVEGYVIQTGEGVDYHGTVKKSKGSYRAQYLPKLLLDFTPLACLSETPLFFQQLAKLRDINYDSNSDEPFNIHQFYADAIAHWPGTITTGEGPTKGAQRGPTCRMKVFLRLLEEYYGHHYPKVKFYLRVYSTCGMLGTIIDASTASCIKLALNKAKNTLLKVNQREPLAQQDPARGFLIVLTHKVYQLSQTLFCPHVEENSEIGDLNVFRVKFDFQNTQAWLTIRSEGWEDLQATYSLEDLVPLSRTLSSLTKKAAGRYALHVLSCLPPATEWVLPDSDLTIFRRWLAALIDALEPDDEGRIILTPQHRATFKNLEEGFLDMAGKMKRPWYRKWVTTLFEDKSYKVHNKYYLSHIYFRSPEKDLNDPFLQAVLEGHPGLTATDALQRDLGWYHDFFIPLQLSFLLFLTEHACLARKDVSLNIQHRSDTNSYGYKYVHYNLLNGIQEVIPTHGVMWWSYYPWSHEDLDFLRSLIKVTPPNEVVLRTQRGAALGGAFLPWEEIYLLSSVIAAPFPRLLQLFDYLRFYPYRLQENPFRALCEQLMDMVLKSEEKIISQLPVSSWILEFFDSQISIALDEGDTVRTGFFLRLFAKLQAYYPTTSDAWTAHLERVLQAFVPSAVMCKDLSSNASLQKVKTDAWEAYDDKPRLAFYYQLIALAPYLSPSSKVPHPLLQRLASLLALTPHSNEKSFLIQEDFARGCCLLQNLALPVEHRVATLPLPLLQHKEYPFLDRCPTVTLTSSSEEEYVYDFIDSDGVSATVTHSLRKSTVRFSKVFGNKLSHLCLRAEDYNSKVYYGLKYLLESQKVSCWQSEDVTVYFVDKISHHTLAIWQKDKGLYHPRSGQPFAPLSSSSRQPSLLCLDDLKYTLPWSTAQAEGRLGLVEYPRLGLSFERRDDGYYYEASPHGRRVIDQRVPELIRWQHYIVVQDEDGKKSVLLPQAFPTYRDLLDSFPLYRPSLVYSDTPKVFDYPLSAIGEVMPSHNTYADLWLIALLLQYDQYEKAYQLAKGHLQHLRTWPEEERLLLLPAGPFYPSSLDVSSYRRHGIVSAVRIRLAMAAFPLDKDLPKSLPTYLTSDYLNYLDQFNSVEGLLSKEEEQRMLLLCRHHKVLGNRFMPRSKDLGMSLGYVNSYVLPPGPSSVSLGFVLTPSSDPLEVPEDLSCLSERNVVRHARHLATWAKTADSAKKRQLCTAMERLIFSSDPAVALSAAYLHLTASLPSDAQDPDDVSIRKYLDKLRSQAIDKLPHYARVKNLASHSVRVPLFRPTTVIEALPALQLEEVSDIGFLLAPLASTSAIAPSLHQELECLSTFYSCSTQEACIHRVFEEKQASLQAFRRSHDARHRKIQEGSLPNYDACRLNDTKVFEQVQKSLQSHLRQLKSQAHAARTTLEDKLRARYLADTVDHRLPFPLTLKEVVAHLAREKYQDLVACLPSLQKDLADLRQEVASYLMLATELQHLRRAQKALALTQNEQNPTSLQQARDAFIEVMSLKRQYHHHQEESFTYLAAEWTIGKRLFSFQIKMVRDLSDPSKPPCNAVAETGFGKSSVVIPLILLLLSKKPGVIPVMTLPTPLVEEEALLLKNFLGKFGLSIYHVAFDRTRAQDVDEVQRLQKTMESAQDTLFIMSMSTAQIISDLALKASFLQKSDATLCTALRGVRELWQTRVCNFVDESRELWGADEHIYAVGQRRQVSWEHRMRAATFYCEFLLHPKILAKWQFSFLPHEGDDKKEISEENYWELKKDLLLLMKDYLMRQEDQEVDQAGQFLYGSDHRSYFDYDPNLRYWKNQLNTYLPTTLKAKYGSRYQRHPDKGNYLAVPCAAGTPRPSYEFASLDELINFTMQANLAGPLPCTLVDEFLTLLASNISAGKASPNDRTTLHDLLKRASLERGVHTQQEVLALTDYLNDHLHDKALFISMAIVSKIAPYSHKIASTSHTFVLSHKTHGASATASIHHLPPKMTARLRPKAGIGNLVSLLVKEAQILVLPPCAAQRLLSSSLQQGVHHVLIDQAGLFSHLKLETLQQAIFNCRPSCQHLLFYDATGMLMVWKRGDFLPKEGVALPDLETSFIYLSESKAVGTDIPMLPYAKLLITLDWRVTHHRLEQALGRGRLLQKGQSADFVITDTNWQLIRDYLKKEKIHTDLPIGNLLRYAACQEGLQGSLEFYQSLYRHAQALLEQQIFAAPPEQWRTLVRGFADLLTLPTEPENPILPEVKILPWQAAISQVRHAFFSRFEEACEQLSAYNRYLIERGNLLSQWSAYASKGDRLLTRNIHTQTLNASKEQVVCTAVELQRQANSMTNQNEAKYISFLSRISPYSSREVPSLFNFKILFSSSFSEVSSFSDLANTLFKKPAYNYLLKIKPSRTIYLAVIADPQEITDAVANGYYYLKDDKVLARPLDAMPAPFPSLSSLVNNPIQVQQILLLAKLFRREKDLSPSDWDLLKQTGTTQALIDWAKTTLSLTLSKKIDS